MAIYVCCDIHGQYELYKKMLDEIHLSDNDILYILGDLIDRGKDGIKILQDVINQPNIICLIGNHELMMLHYCIGGNTGSWWRNSSNGGEQTFNDLTNLSEEEQRRIINYIEDMYLQVEITINQKTYLLSHSSFIDGGTIKCHKLGFDNHRVEEVVWNSPWRFWEYTNISNYKEDERIHIIGHVPVQVLTIDEWPNKEVPQMPYPYIDEENHLINIDLGCAFAEIPEIEQGYLCVMNLTEYANGNIENAFQYFQKENL